MPRRRPPSIDSRAVIYAVGATEDDLDSCEAALREWCAQARMEIASVVRGLDEGAGELMERKGFADAVLAVARYRAAELVVLRVNDLGSAAELAVTDELLRSYDARLQIVEGDTWGGREAARRLGTSVEMTTHAKEALRRVRQRLAYRRRVLGRKHVGQVPYGFRVGAGGDLVEHIDELIAIDTVVRLHCAGVAVPAIVEALVAAGYAPPGRCRGLPNAGEGGAWSVGVVEALIRSGNG